MWAQFWECLWLRVSHGIKINDFLFSKFRIQSKFETKFEEVSKYLNILTRFEEYRSEFKY
jgi:hypothetical protein